MLDVWEEGRSHIKKYVVTKHKNGYKRQKVVQYSMTEIAMRHETRDVTVVGGTRYIPFWCWINLCTTPIDSIFVRFVIS